MSLRPLCSRHAHIDWGLDQPPAAALPRFCIAFQGGFVTLAMWGAYAPAALHCSSLGRTINHSDKVGWAMLLALERTLHGKQQHVFQLSRGHKWLTDSRDGMALTAAIGGRHAALAVTPRPRTGRLRLQHPRPARQAAGLMYTCTCASGMHP